MKIAKDKQLNFIRNGLSPKQFVKQRECRIVLKRKTKREKLQNDRGIILKQRGSSNGSE